MLKGEIHPVIKGDKLNKESVNQYVNEKNLLTGEEQFFHKSFETLNFARIFFNIKISKKIVIYRRDIPRAMERENG